MYWTVLCYHPYLVSMLFADLLSLHLVTFLMFFILVHVTFLAADACLSWRLPSITEQQVSPHRLPMQYWLKNHRLSSNAPYTSTVFLIQQSCVIINFVAKGQRSKVSDLCACVHVKKNGVVKEAIVLQWAVRIASRGFKPGEKRWASALLSEKCCCFVRKPSWKSHANLN